MSYFPLLVPLFFFIKHLRCCQKVLTFFTHSLIIDFVVLSKFNCYVPEVRKLKWSELSSLFLKWFSLDRKILFKDNCDFHLTLPFHVFFFLHPCSNPTLKKKKKKISWSWHFLTPRTLSFSFVQTEVGMGILISPPHTIALDTLFLDD